LVVLGNRFGRLNWYCWYRSRCCGRFTREKHPYTKCMDECNLKA
jgi:hypothetical protein